MGKCSGGRQFVPKYNIKYYKSIYREMFGRSTACATASQLVLKRSTVCATVSELVRHTHTHTHTHTQIEQSVRQLQRLCDSFRDCATARQSVRRFRAAVCAQL